jgi:hypothetical protein
MIAGVRGTEGFTERKNDVTILWRRVPVQAGMERLMVSNATAAYCLSRGNLTPGDRVLLNGSNDDGLLSVTARPADGGL